MIITTSRALLLLLTLAACGDPPVDAGTTGDSSSSTGEPDADESSSTGSADAEGSGSASTSTGEDSTGAPVDACFGDQCTGQCGPGLLCAPHPDNASLAVCAAPCTLEGPPCALEVDGCGEAPLGECRVSFAGTVLCFPVLCDGSAGCESGECIDGRCA